MAKRKVVAAAQQEVDETLVDISQVGAKASDFWSKYGKIVTYVGGGLLLLVAGYLAYKYIYQAPRQKEAVVQMYQAQMMFERDSFELALNSPGGGNSGFLDIISQYGGTAAGNAAKYYAGVSYLNLGQYDNAIKYLDDYSCEGDVTPITKHSAMGDAYSELGQFDKAAKEYEHAAEAGDNDVLTPMVMKKQAMLLEKQGNPSAAVKVYQALKDKYGKSQEGMDIDKYIIRASGKK